MQKEAKLLFRMKRIIDDTAKMDSPLVLMKQKIMLEDSFGRMLRMKDISGRAFGIIKRHLDRKIPKGRYCEHGGEIKKAAPRSNISPEKEMEIIMARSNDSW